MQITRESIFTGAVRAFCTAFAAILGIFLAIALGVIVIFMLSTPNLLPPSSQAQIAPDAEGNRTMLPLSSPAILRIDINGEIGKKSLTGSDIRDILLDSREDILAHDRVKGVLLYVNTPGGAVTDADDMYRSLMAYKKKYNVPIYAYVDGLCASGGMYVTAACDKIYSSPSSIIGSVGVIFGPAFNFSQTMEKIGVQSLTLRQGKDKDMLNPFRPWTPGEDESLRNIMGSMYGRFVDILTAARPNLDKEQLVQTYGAQVYVAEKAQELGYIDNGNSTYEETLTALTNAAGIPADHHYQVILLEKQENLIDQLFEGKAELLKGKITHHFEFGPHTTSDMNGKFLYLYQP